MDFENDDDTDANDGHDDHADEYHPGTEYPAILTCWSSTQNQPWRRFDFTPVLGAIFLLWR